MLSLSICPSTGNKVFVSERLIVSSIVIVPSVIGVEQFASSGEGDCSVSWSSLSVSFVSKSMGSSDASTGSPNVSSSSCFSLLSEVFS